MERGLSKDILNCLALVSLGSDNLPRVLLRVKATVKIKLAKVQLGFGPVSDMPGSGGVRVPSFPHSHRSPEPSRGHRKPLWI